ncbi:MAG: enolase C-terminal domain-like protein [Myxococcota bacterium]
MRLEGFGVHRVRIPLKSKFQHASQAREQADFVVFELRDEAGNVGFGESQPRPYVSGETVEGVALVDGPLWLEGWMGRELSSFSEVRAFLLAELDRAGRKLAMFCGLELGLLDLAGRRFGVPLGAVLAEALGPPLPGGVVIGFEIETAALPKHCAMLRLAGKKHLKVKVGRPDDLERLTAIAGVLKGLPLILDANEAWDVDAAIAQIQSFSGVPIACVEQPIDKADLPGMRRIREATGVKLMADESLITLADAETLIASEAADVFHIRLGKLGGLLGAERVVARAKRAGIGLHLGTMVGESGLLSRASEIFGRAVPGFACLDGKAQNTLLLSEDLLADPSAAASAPADAVGLGVTVDPEKLARLGARVR